MKAIELDVLSKNELTSVKEGGWVYNENDGKRYWVTENDPGDPNFIGEF